MKLNGTVYNLASKAGATILKHYQMYMEEGDLSGAGDCIGKFHHFFSMYDMEHYFADYYRGIKDIE